MDVQHPEFTSNAQLLLGLLMGAVKTKNNDLYRLVHYDAETGTFIVERTETGNRFAVAVRQISGDY